MKFSFYDQCCDALGYIQNGIVCATQGDCWNILRPIGGNYYSSIPVRMGWPSEALVGMNLFLVWCSILLASRALSVLEPKLARGGWFGLAKILAVTLAHMTFLWADAHTSLSDVPATSMALIGIWLFLLAWRSRGVFGMALAGLFLGIPPDYSPLPFGPKGPKGRGAKGEGLLLCAIRPSP